MKIFYLLIIPCLVITSIYCSKKNTDIPANITEASHPGKVDTRAVKSGPLAGAGQKLFTANCAACHKVEKDMTAPALTGIENRRSREWIYHFTRNNAELLRAGDSTALKLYNDWGKVPMNSFPNLSNKDIDAILAYIKAVENGWQDATKN